MVGCGATGQLVFIAVFNSVAGGATVVFHFCLTTTTFSSVPDCGSLKKKEILAIVGAREIMEIHRLSILYRIFLRYALD